MPPAQVADAPGLVFGGLQAYQGSAQHKRGHDERAQLIERAVEMVTETVELLGRDGLACPLIGGAGTGTYPFEAASGVYTELQAGSYIFMDADYARNFGEDGAAVSTYEHSLFVYTTVMSRALPERAFVDAGLKAHSVDSGMPWVHGMEGVVFTGASDEHGKLEIADPRGGPQVGDKLRLIPGHCDPTVNLYDWFVCVRDGKVEALWPISARGLLW